MKTRQGFVSNSSSSSFLLVTSEQEHQRVIEHIRTNEENGNQIAETMDLRVGRKTIGDTKLVVLAQGYGEVWDDYDPMKSVEGLDNQPQSTDDDEGDEDHDLRYEAESTYKKVCKDMKVACITQDLSL